jgi:2,5-dichloro-2,5-cyclohexadiene-1,4-diol dehydrogenase 2
MSKIALVTGATSGIGEEVVRVYAEQGWRVMATGRNQAQGDKLVAELGADLCAFRAADL